MNYAEYMVSVLRPVGFFSAYVILIIEAAHAISNEEEWSFSFDLFPPFSLHWETNANQHPPTLVQSAEQHNSGLDQPVSGSRQA